MSNTVIKVSNVVKTFKLPHEKQSSIKGLFVGLFTGKKSYEKQKVLHGLSFEVKEGEFFGIVGRNGSGKSTLLKLIAGIYAPNQGSIQINGKLTPFIELGVGFNPELTGRENVYLNGALLGFSRTEMHAMYDDIVDFAELHKFMDQKLKNYSSGMQVRLAFSIAIRSKSDILILDEVLAVGDEAFQRKCLDVFENYKKNQQTVVLVTHDMGVVEKYCNRAILISEGKIVDQGDPKKVAKHYSLLNAEATNIDTAKQNNKIDNKQKIKVRLLNNEGNEASNFNHGDWLRVSLTWPEELRVKNVGVAILKSTGDIVFANNTTETKGLKIKNSIEYKVNLNLLPGRYSLMAGLFGTTDTDVIEFLDNGPMFSVNKIDKVWGGITVLDSIWND